MRKTPVTMSVREGAAGEYVFFRITPTGNPESSSEVANAWFFQWDPAGTLTIAQIQGSIIRDATNPPWMKIEANAGFDGQVFSFRIGLDPAQAETWRTDWGLTWLATDGDYEVYDVTPKFQSCTILESLVEIGQLPTVLAGDIVLYVDAAGAPKAYIGVTTPYIEGTGGAAAVETALKAANPGSWGNIGFQIRFQR